MKLLLLWLVATWVVAVTADRPCSEYCVYLSSGLRDIEFQTGCDCMYDEPELEDDVGARILYEPAPILQDYIHNQPFYILNPITSRRRTDPTDSNPVTSKTGQTSLNAYTYNPDIKLNENTHSNQKRQEKDIRSISKKINTPIYLDVHVDLEDVTRSASSNPLTAEELNVTEQNLLECANLYTELHSRKNTDTKHYITGSKQLNDYSHTTNEELKKEIQNKCSHISFIVEESLNEIKKTRSKITSVTYKMDNNEQQNNKQSHSNGIKIKNKYTLRLSNHENNSNPSIQNEYSESTKQDTEKYEKTTIPPTDSSKNTPTDTLSSEVLSTDLTHVAKIQSSLEVHTSTEKNIDRQGTTPRYTENEYRFHEESGTTMASTSEPFLAGAIISKDTEDALTSKDTEYALTPKDKENLNIVEDNQTEKELKSVEVERQSENRAKYEESEVPLIKIITHEFANDTVQSFINGTEDIPNGDFSDELKPADVDKQTEDSTKSPTSNQYIRSTLHNETKSPITEDQKSTDTDLSGNLYFLFNNKRIPARFVQNANGSLHVGIDGVSLCNTLTENTDQQSVILTNLCNCYAPDNCNHKKTD